MNISVTTGIPILTVFLEGVISFFSPCVLPLIPVYIAYLSGGTLKRETDGSFHYDRKKVMINTFFFTLGISFAFLILGLGMSALGRLFSGHQLLFSRIGGVIIILFGLYQMGFFGTNLIMSRERRLPFNTDKMTMSPFTALLFGFLISFAWTPCIGPVLSSILIMTASSDTMLSGIMLIFVYTLGYVIPFLLVGVFTTSLLEFFSRHRSIVRYSVKTGGALLIVIGILMYTGQMNGLSSCLSAISFDSINTVSEYTTAETAGKETPVNEELYKTESASVNNGDIGKDSVTKIGKTDTVLNNTLQENTDGTIPDSDDESSNLKHDNSEKDSVIKNTDESGKTSDSQSEEETTEEIEQETTKSDSNENVFPAYDFTLEDRYGNTHSLSDYRGKIIFLNFWATWCPPCKQELPHIQELFEEYSAKPDSDIVFLTITFPNLGREKSVSGIKSFLDDQGYTFPVLMDTEYITNEQYYISAYPTTFLIDPHGNILGYVPGAMNREMMEDVIDRARRESGY